MRKRALNLNDNKLPSEDHFDLYRIGSESCAALLPDVAGIRMMADRIDSGRLTLVTPVAGQRDLDLVLSTAELALSLGFSELVVNDWGVLREFSGEGRGKLTAGRLLMRFRRGPGQTDPWEDMDLKSRKYFAWGPLFDSALLSFLRGLGISRLELDPPRHWQDLPDSSGFDLSFHGEFRLVSTAAVCPWREEDTHERPETLGNCHKCLDTGPVFLDSGQLDRPLLQWGRSILEDAAADWSDKALTPEVDRIIFEGEPLSGMVSANNSSW